MINNNFHKHEEKIKTDILVLEGQLAILSHLRESFLNRIRHIENNIEKYETDSKEANDLRLLCAGVIWTLEAIEITMQDINSDRNFIQGNVGKPLGRIDKNAN